MKVVILCGGKGTRMSELTNEVPKPLAKVGDKPLLWHIMKRYNQYGFDEFILLLGYKGEMIKEYFMNYNWKNHSFTLDTSSGSIQLLQEPENWKITFLDTGLETMTGGRIKIAEKHLGTETFMLTYADGLADINLLNLLNFHKNTGAIATVTGVNRISQFGTLTVKNGLAESFHEKTQSEGIINGGFFVLEPKVFDYVSDSPLCVFEEESLKNLALDRELAVYLHEGFWMAADTYKNVLELNEMWKQGKNLWAK
ncbi:sugar phosphate nucleotidyltransferase [Paenibacillus qinlingensis]|uniref:Glucose-1-phosphate cytidylyltransferase n=1 Tax=Paenibacillus qinlingensis TaxID=1837343 RepID=A0ABU1NTP5_9BACL|nr:sugar phosphate nucleotidyltransferase [Paenibacillus qinlingensis]MDR6550714.1 glucose-1-phosphate cytidylyltransferase [Paenibacillus qinlingensis]